MKPYECEAVRDLLPQAVRGELLTHEASAVELHVASCADCAAENDLVRLVRYAWQPVPADLEGRVLKAVRQAPAMPARRFAPMRLALAATVAAALIGGALITRQLDSADSPTFTSAPATASLLGWVGAEDPMLHSGTTLDELTEDELELLLAELDS